MPKKPKPYSLPTDPYKEMTKGRTNPLVDKFYKRVARIGTKKAR